MDKIKIAVTGAAGHVGSVLVRRMLEFPHIDAVAICRNEMSAGLIHSVAPGCNIRIGSITDSESSQELLGDCDVIVNCAIAIVSGDPKRSLLLNKTMIDNFSRLGKLKSLIHLSSISVYGICIENGKHPKSTFDRPRPIDNYGRSKLYIEEYAKRMCLSKQLTYYMLRLGNVVGAGTDRSRMIIELARNPYVYLPFNGELASNTIHVEDLAAMIIALLSNTLPSGIYNVANEQTWRQIFDWHTQAIGLPLVKGMSKEHSEHLRNNCRSPSVRGDISSWFHSLPLFSLIRYPGIFEFAYRLVGIAPESITNRLATIYKRKAVGRQIATASKYDNEIVSLEYFYDAMPGTYLRIPSEVRLDYPSPEELSNDLKRWYERFSKPTWLPNSCHD